MMDVTALETANNLHDRIHLANVAEKLVAQAFSLARARDESGDVNELDRRRHCAYRFGHLCERLQPRVRDRNDSLVRIDRAKRVIRGLSLVSASHRVEQR